MITIDRGSQVPLQQQICDQVAAAVGTGRLRPGEVLPASRELARQLGVSRTVVLRAYQLLGANGVLTGQQGSSTRIADSAAERLSPGRSAKVALVPQPPVPTRGGALWRPWDLDVKGRRPDIDFRHDSPALNHFPLARWRRSLDNVHTRADALSLGYGPAEGSPALRDEVSRLVRRSRGLDASPDRVLITSGATQAMDILARVLVGPGDVVVIEDPSHTVLRQIFGISAGSVVPVPVDEEGLRVEDIDGYVRAAGHDPARVRLVYLTPSHQFPTGVVMSRERRAAMLDWARDRRAVVLEDDYHNEFSGTEGRLQALAADDTHGSVVYVGSFSKTLYPALRIGYAILPPRLIRPFLGVKWITDRLTPTVMQEALADFIAIGAFDRHISRMSRLYRVRRQRLVAALDEFFGDGARVSGAGAGLHVLVRLAAARGAGEQDIRLRATARGVKVYPASGYFIESPPDEPTFLMGYATLPESAIHEGVRLLRAAALGEPR
ncbi:MocR-like pyridoxine biosynthesis transcription factor PdxR [Actinokineospora spheciospongiae]|uniref:MocR-like pyridoxine biosynthesis transcription factor PdxR n=1 Tax=Actinokineospora spheciospongiae TaxID=909613 RepID=UPI001C642BBB|nr:PLP-dependent aminotransferase family protein [Actinokineospora spheciospongiae]